MKKLFLSLAVIVSFSLYSVFTKKQTFESSLSQFVPTVTSAPPTISNSDSTNDDLRSVPTATTSKSTSGLKDGEFTGDVADAFYGNIQVKATIQNGKIADVQFLQYPNDRETSRMINGQAMPILKSEAIQAQSENVDIVSGATDTSHAFIESMKSALNKAKNS